MGEEDWEEKEKKVERTEKAEIKKAKLLLRGEAHKIMLF